MSLKKFYGISKKVSSDAGEQLQKRPTRAMKAKKNFKSKNKSESDSSDFPEENTQASPDSARNRMSPISSEAKLKSMPKKLNIEKTPKSSKKTQKKPKKSSASTPDPSAGPLSDKTFVITGLFKNYSREMLTDTLKEYGAKVTANVSTRTSFLVHGEQLEDGRPYTAGLKYKKAVELKKDLLNEQDLEILLKNLTKSPTKAEGQTQVIAPDKLLTDKYKPQRLKDLIGNRNIIKKLKTWLKEWQENNLNGSNSDKSGLRAALISGTPGIGKTTAARLVAQKFGYLALETNSSDTRSKSLIDPLVTGTSISDSINMNAEIQRTLIIMDEVDGMAGGDKGGIPALVSMIKSTKVPIICICNDRQSPKLKTLAKHCLELKFSKPNKLQIIKKLQEILESENMKVDKNALELIIETSKNDIRQILTILEVWRRESRQISYMEAKNSTKSISKDASTLLNFFEASSKLFNPSELKQKSYKEKLDLVFIDYQMIPQIVFDTYLQALDNSDLNSLSEAADSLSLSDQLNTEIYKKGNWSLLPVYLQESCLHPAALCTNFIPYTKFPEYFAKYSVINKHQRYVVELKNALKNSAVCDSESVVNEFAPVVCGIVCRLLKLHNVSAAAQSLFELGLNPEMLTEYLKAFVPGFSITSSQKKMIQGAFNAYYSGSIQKINRNKTRLESDDSDSLASDDFLLDDETLNIT